MHALSLSASDNTDKPTDRCRNRSNHRPDSRLARPTKGSDRRLVVASKCGCRGLLGTRHASLRAGNLSLAMVLLQSVRDRPAVRQRAAAEDDWTPFRVPLVLSA